MPAELKIVLITRQPRARLLRRTYASASLAAFRLRETGQSYEVYQSEEEELEDALSSVRRTLQHAGHLQEIDRSLLPTHAFHEGDVLVALGQDGLVANTLRYSRDLLVIGVNPRPKAYEGTLLPFTPETLHDVMHAVTQDRAATAMVTLAEARFSDGRTLRAANDFFVGRNDHASALYRISHRSAEERHSSSGVIISTPLGSTAWQRSIVTGAAAVVSALGRNVEIKPKAVAWDEKRLRFWVREPWPSLQSSAKIVAGVVSAGEQLTLSSEMGEGGVIFADGLQADASPFLAGDVVRFELSAVPARIAVNPAA